MSELVGGDLSRIGVLGAAAGLDLPGLVVHDRHDLVVPWSDGREIAARWPRARFVATDGLGHRKVLRAPEVNRLILGFLRQAAAAPARRAGPLATSSHNTH